MFEEVLIPEAVLGEINQHPRPDAKDQLLHAISEGVLKIHAVTSQPMKSVLLLELDEGEAEAITLAIEQHVDCVFIDEKEGRKIARRMGLDCKGTIWLLSHAKNKGLISSLKDALNTLVDEFAFALDPELIEESYKRVGEV